MYKKSFLSLCLLLSILAEGNATEPEFQKNIGWASLRDLSSESFSENFTKYKNDGYRMIDVDCYEVSGGVKYSMVWEKNVNNIAWAEYRDMTDETYHNKWEQLKNDGYRPVDIESYRKNGTQLFAGIWIKNTANYSWSSKRNLTKQDYETYITEQKAEGRKMIDLEMYETTNGIRYAAIWVKNYNNAVWKEVHGLDRDDYQTKLNELTNDGYLVTQFDSYKDGSTQRYAFLCEKRSGYAYQLRSDRTELEYANIWREYRDKGYRLIDFECYKTSSGMRYGGVWIENNPRYDYEKKTQLDNIISKYQRDSTVPGISVVIIKNGEMIYRRGFGFADKEAGKVAHGETVYLTASISKVIGGTIAVKLADEGKLRNGTNVSLNLNSPISTYLTNVRKTDGSLVTIPSKHTQLVKELYAHLGCIQHYEGPEPVERQYTKSIDALTQIWNADFVPDCIKGLNTNYSTHAHTYLAAILEKITNRTAPQLVKSEIAVPYNLGTMRVQHEMEQMISDYDRAKAYATTNAPMNYENNSWKIFGGGIEISTVDLAEFGWKLLDGKIIKPSARDNILWSPVKTNGSYGIAWWIGSKGGKKVAEHGGSADGARSHIRIYRDDKIVIAIMSNRRGHEPDDSLVDNIANIVL